MGDTDCMFLLLEFSIHTNRKYYQNRTIHSGSFFNEIPLNTTTIRCYFDYYPKKYQVEYDVFSSTDYNGLPWFD